MREYWEWETELIAYYFLTTGHYINEYELFYSVWIIWGLNISAFTYLDSAIIKQNRLQKNKESSLFAFEIEIFTVSRLLQ